jgi:hypothetical protein
VSWLSVPSAPGGRVGVMRGVPVGRFRAVPWRRYSLDWPGAPFVMDRLAGRQAEAGVVAATR